MTADTIPKKFLMDVFDQAAREYPHECCGMIIGPKAKPEELSRVRPCRNVQDEYHARDPENFPRASKTAYFIDPKELLVVQKECRENEEDVRVIYHSHIDAGAYFSEEDKRIAASDGEPAYPGVSYLVVSVIQEKACDAHLFRWDPKEKDFVG